MLNDQKKKNATHLVVENYAQCHKLISCPIIFGQDIVS